LEQAVAIAGKSGDTDATLLATSRLGAVCVRVRQLDRAESLLLDSLQKAHTANNTGMSAAILNDLGTLRAAQAKDTEALVAFRDSIAQSRKTGNHLLTAQALCNAAKVAARLNDMTDAQRLNQESIAAINQLGTSSDKAFLLVAAALTSRQFNSDDGKGAVDQVRHAHDTLQAALTVATSIGDHRNASLALGYLGTLYFDDNQLEQAQALTRRAIFEAQQASATEMLYRWEWQSGKILARLGQSDAAISAYQRALRTLQDIRQDVSQGCGCATDQLSFREANGSLFFELADLLLQQAASTTDTVASQKLLIEARDTVEQLKTVELQDYFEDDCAEVVRTKTKSLEAIDRHTAVIYIVPLPTRTEVLVSLSSDIQRFAAPVGVAELTQVVRDYRRNLETRTSYSYRKQAKQLYDWLIRPIHGALTENKVNTLVFVPDGALLTIPFASLYDGERFLIEEFAVAAAPGLSLIEPRPIGRGNARLLLSGLSKAVQGFPGLDFVPSEIEKIEPLYQSRTLMDTQFVKSSISKALSQGQYSIVHIASHGKFSRDVNDTFVLTYDSKLTMNDLESLIRPGRHRGQPVEMLILSACQTAAGDDRAALGLAGVAVKAGARSAVATLWFVNDQSTSELVTELYSQLRQTPSISKARALQAAQIKLLNDRRYQHPCYWAPYLIIGNWL
jgi:CHAT domain-containing protein